MAVTLLTFSGQNILPEYDAEARKGMTGFTTMPAVTLSGSNLIHLTECYGMIAGYQFQITAMDVPVSLPSSGTVSGALYLHLDTTNAQTPLEVIADAVPIYQYGGGVYDMEIARFTATPSGASGLTDTAPRAISNMLIKRNTAYAVGDVVTCPSAPAGVMLLCNAGGTTAAVEPVFSNANPTTTVTDGTVTWWAFTPKPPQGMTGKAVNAGGGLVDIVTLQPGLYLFTAQMLFALPSGGGSFSASIIQGGTDEIAYVSGYETDAKNAGHYIATLVSLSQAEMLGFRKYGVATQVTCKWTAVKII